MTCLSKLQIEQTDVISRTTHVRLVSLMALLSIVDTSFVFFCSSKVLDLGPSVYILFGFEVRRFWFYSFHEPRW